VSRRLSWRETAERQERIIVLWLGGLPISRIAKKLGMDRANVYRSIRYAARRRGIEGAFSMTMPELKQALLEQRANPMSRAVCLDFDGVLNTYEGWKGEGELFEPREGAREFIEALQKLGYEVVIHSTREPMRIVSWMIDHGVADAVEYNGEVYTLGSFYEDRESYEHITGRPASRIVRVTRTKPPAIVYIDDRAIRFDGDYNRTINTLINFRAHWEREKEQA